MGTTTQTFGELTATQHAWADAHGMTITDNRFGGWAIALKNPPAGFESLYVSIPGRDVCSRITLCGYLDNKRVDPSCNFVRLATCETVKQGIKELLMRGSL